MKTNRNWIIIFIFSFIPVLLWLVEPRTISPFANFTNTTASVGQLLALIGTTLFAINLILSARFHILEKIFGGLDNVYEKHDKIGQLAFIMLLFHPLFLLPKYSSGSIAGAMSFLLPSGNPALIFGWLALVIMLLLIIITLYLKPRYDIWKWTHKFLGGAFFLASLHIFLIPSDISVYLPLRIYILSFSLLGIFSFCYYTLLGNFLVKKHTYKIISVLPKSSEIFEIAMVPANKKIKYIPGQFIFVQFFNRHVSKESHPFSIISDASENELAIAIKNSGDYTESIKKLTVGSTAKIEGPYGTFSYKKSIHKKQIWIAGGIGITPFLSMAKDLRKNPEYNVDLYYCVRNDFEAAYISDLKDVAPNLKVIPFYSEINGRINAEFIIRDSNTVHNKDIFICAPKSMILSLKKQFEELEVRKDFIHSEEFNF